MSTNIRVFEVEFRGAGGKRESVEVALCSTYTGWALVLPKPASIALGSPALERSPLAARLSNISPDEPFPKPNAATGRPRFCVKTYSENAGLLPQLVDADVLHPSGRPELRCGPLVEVALGDLEISHTCLKCARGGMLEAVETREMPGRPRLPACSGCKVARYCDAQVRLALAAFNLAC